MKNRIIYVSFMCAGAAAAVDVYELSHGGGSIYFHHLAWVVIALLWMNNFRMANDKAELLEEIVMSQQEIIKEQEEIRMELRKLLKDNESEHEQKDSELHTTHD